MTVTQIKSLKKIIDQQLIEKRVEIEFLEKERQSTLTQIGNIVHESVPVSDDEENNRVERTYGDIKSKAKYSHVCLGHFIFEKSEKLLLEFEDWKPHEISLLINHAPN